MQILTSHKLLASFRFHGQKKQITALPKPYTYSTCRHYKSSAQITDYTPKQHRESSHELAQLGANASDVSAIYRQHSKMYGISLTVPNQMAELSCERLPRKDRSLPFRQQTYCTQREVLGLHCCTREFIQIKSFQYISCTMSPMHRLCLVYFCETTGVPEVWQQPYQSNK